MVTAAQLICNTFGGIRSKNALFSGDIITASDMQNVELYDTGINNGIGIRTTTGNKCICDLFPDDENLINVFKSVQYGATYHFIHTSNIQQGKIYLYDNERGTIRLMREWLSPTDSSCGTDFMQGWADLFVFSNGIDMLVIDMHAEDQVVDLVVEDIDGRYVSGLGLINYNNRLWIFSGNVLWYSAQSNIYDFATSDAEISTSAGYIEYVKAITAIYPYLGSIAVFFKDSSLILSGEFPYEQTDESPGGCAGYNSLVFHGTELYFYDDTKKGVFSFKQVVLGNKTLGDNIAEEVQLELLKIDSSKLNQIRTLSIVLSDRNEIWFLLPNNGENSTILIYDYAHGEWIKRVSQKIYCLSIIDNIFYSGGTGKLLQEYTTNTFDGEFIQNYYYCTPMNLGSETTLKVLYFPPRVALEGSNYSNTFYVKYIKNYDTSKSPKIKLIKSKFANYMFWDVGFWDIHYWASNILRFIKKLPSATFKALEIHFYTMNSNQNFCMKSIEFSKIKIKQV